MNRFVFALAFALGLATVLWVGAGFVGSSALALLMTVAIAAVYLLGAYEVRQFRAATGALGRALDDLPGPPPELGGWLERVPASLRNAVRLRIEGERIALPGPALTPYLVGLLVMLGMLGTFLGMVVTFKGAVFALEGSTDLHAIRAALSAPIRGLGLSFGTSVAGVAASAMLGLMSALSRRERVEVARTLDARIATALRPFSLAHQRQETFKALQAQAQSLPTVVDRLQALMEGLERRSQQLDDRLVGQQSQFHAEVKTVYAELAERVGHSLQDSLAASARQAGESLKPVVETAMAQLAQESRLAHQRQVDAAQVQLDGMAAEFSATARGVSEGWTQALAQHARTSEALVEGLGRSLEGFSSGFEARAGALVAAVQDAATRAQAQQAEADRQRLEAWTARLEASGSALQQEWQRVAASSVAAQQAVSQALEKAAGDFEARAGALVASVQQAAAQGQAEQVEAERQRLSAWTAQLESAGATLQHEWQRVGAQTLAAQQAVCQSLQAAAGEIAERSRTQAGEAFEGIARLLDQSEALVRTRTEAEARWIAQQGERMDQLAGLWRSEMAALRDDEAARGAAAVARLGELQSALAQHLATLGTALEAPLGRLLQTASEVPQAAAEVITQLRQEMARMTERDNLALEERSALVAQIQALLQTLNQASGEQRAAIESLVASASGVLDHAGSRFSQVLEAQATHAADTAGQLSASAVELSALGESFNHGVTLFSASHEKLADSLQRVESALQQSMARSDEQLAYYVAQAREVIDLSISAQQGIVEDLRRLRSEAVAEGSA